MYISVRVSRIVLLFKILAKFIARKVYFELYWIEGARIFIIK